MSKRKLIIATKEKLEIVSGAAPPPFRILAGGSPRRGGRRNAFGLIQEYCTISTRAAGSTGTGDGRVLGSEDQDRGRTQRQQLQVQRNEVLRRNGSVSMLGDQIGEPGKVNLAGRFRRSAGQGNQELFLGVQ